MNNVNDKIIIQDNFFSKDMLDKIKVDLTHQKFTNRFTEHTDSIYQKIYFHSKLTEDHPVVLEVKKILKEKFELTYLNIDSQYFLSTKHEEATPHRDVGHEYNCLIYLKGDFILNSGTGFYDYDEINNQYSLNTHVGFKENRAIIFDSRIYHSSLQFNEGGKTRYCLANFINRIETETEVKIA